MAFIFLIRLAQQISHLPSLEHALTSTAIVRQLRPEASEAQTQAEASLAISQEQGFAMRLAMGNILRGWSLVMRGHALIIPRVIRRFDF